MRRVSAFRHFRLDFRQCRTYSQGRLFNAQQVRLRKPWIRRFATTCLVYGAAFHLWTSLVYLQFDSEITQSSTEDHVAQKGGATDEIDDTSYSEDENASFIPLSWPRLCDGELYAYTDPEWKAFAKIRADVKGLQKIKTELLQIAGKRLAAAPQCKHLFGVNMKIGQEWLLPFFPYRAPPHYERYGLEISDTEIALVSQTMRPEDGDKMWKALFPLTVASATFQGLSVLYRRKMDRIQTYLGIDDAASSSTDKVIKGVSIPPALKARTSNLMDFSEWETLNANPAENNPPATAAKATPTTAEEKPAREYPAKLPPLISMLQNVPFPDFNRGSDLHVAMLAFKKHLLKAARQHKTIPKRGVFYFSGPLSLEGPLGECRVDVRGEYDPSQKKFTGMWFKLRDVTLYTQDALATPRFDEDG